MIAAGTINCLITQSASQFHSPTAHAWGWGQTKNKQHNKLNKVIEATNKTNKQICLLISLSPTNQFQFPCMRMRMVGMTYDTLQVWGQECVLCKSSIAFVFSEKSYCGDTEKSPADNSHFLSETVTECGATSVCNTDCLAGVQYSRSFLENIGFPTANRRFDTPAIHKALPTTQTLESQYGIGVCEHLGLELTSCLTLQCCIHKVWIHIERLSER